MNTDHIIHNSTTQRMECQHCGFTQGVKMPDTIDNILAQFDAFTEAHKACQRLQSETVMSDYILGFDAGCDYIIREIELWQGDVGKDLLAHLRMESKQSRETT